MAFALGLSPHLLHCLVLFHMLFPSTNCDLSVPRVPRPLPPGSSNRPLLVLTSLWPPVLSSLLPFLPCMVTNQALHPQSDSEFLPLFLQGAAQIGRVKITLFTSITKAGMGRGNNKAKSTQPLNCGLFGESLNMEGDQNREQQLWSLNTVSQVLGMGHLIYAI